MTNEPGSDELLEAIDPDALDKVDELLEADAEALHNEQSAVEAVEGDLDEPGEDYPERAPIDPLVESIGIVLE